MDCTIWTRFKGRDLVTFYVHRICGGHVNFVQDDKKNRYLSCKRCGTKRFFVNERIFAKFTEAPPLKTNGGNGKGDDDALY